MPRALTLVLLTLWALPLVAAQGTVTPAPVWVFEGPAEPVQAGQSFTVRAEVRLPPGWYQDAHSPFLVWEPRLPFTVLERGSSPPALRAGKESYTGTFTLTRTLLAPADLTEGVNTLRWDVGWQICQVDGVCLLPETSTREMPLRVETSDSSLGFWAALWGALAGGLLLNLMPCVFPVLALKALSLVSAAGRPSPQRRRELAAFAMGSWAAVGLLGLATAALAWFGQRLEWGVPFQQPLFVAVLAGVFFFLALSLVGLLPWRGLPFALTSGAVPTRFPTLRAAGGGLFLVVAATPCTAPLLGPALGFALGRPPVEIPLYFFAIGMGLAAPSMLMALFPGWARALPRPGRWLVWLERGAGVLLGATTLYLLFVLGLQTGGAVWAVGAGLVGAATALVLGRRVPRWQGGARALAVLGLAGAALTLVVPTPSAAPLPQGWGTFTPASFDAALASGRPVLIDATAAWCATCQVNEAAVLHRPDVAAVLDRYAVVRLRADYTAPDPAIRDWLRSVQRAGLPVYALYRPGLPVLLFPELLTDENFTQRLPSLLESP